MCDRSSTLRTYACTHGPSHMGRSPHLGLCLVIRVAMMCTAAYSQGPSLCVSLARSSHQLILRILLASRVVQHWGSAPTHLALVTQSVFSHMLLTRETIGLFFVRSSRQASTC